MTDHDSETGFKREISGDGECAMRSQQPLLSSYPNDEKVEGGGEIGIV